MFLILLILVFPSFTFFDVQSYSNFVDSSYDAAEVDGKVISTNGVDARVREQTGRLYQMLDAQYNPCQFEGPQMRRDVLDDIIQQRMLANEVTCANLIISDEKIRDTILRIPAMVTLRKPDDSFDQEVYIRLLSAQNITPEQLEGGLRFGLSQQQIPQSIVSSAFIPKSLVDHLIQIHDQQHEVQALLFKPADYAAKINTDDKAVQAYYGTHRQELPVLERVKAEHVVFSGEEMVKQVPVTPEQFREYYDQNAMRSKAREERRATRILIKPPDNTEPADKEVIKKKVEEILTEMHKDPTSFADLAKKHSGDPSSAVQSGKLGLLGKGTAVPPFENTLPALRQPGDISDVVQSDFGFHIIELEEVKGGGVQPLEAVKPEFERGLHTQLANKKHSELANALSNTVEDQSDSLKPVADKLKLQIQTADNVTRTPSPAWSGNPIGSDKILKALSADDVIKNHRSTVAIQVGPTTLVTTRAAEYRPATMKELADMREQVKAEAIAEQAAALAKGAGGEKLTAMKQSSSADGFGAMQTVSRQQAQDAPPAALTATLRADATKLPTTVGVDLDAQGYALYYINKMLPPANVDETRCATDAQQLAQTVGQTEFNTYYEALKARSRVEINSSAVDNSKPANTAED